MRERIGKMIFRAVNTPAFKWFLRLTFPVWFVPFTVWRMRHAR